MGRVFQKEETAGEQSHSQEFKEQKVQQDCILECEEGEVRHAEGQMGGITHGEPSKSLLLSLDLF